MEINWEFLTISIGVWTRRAGGSPKSLCISQRPSRRPSLTAFHPRQIHYIHFIRLKGLLRSVIVGDTSGFPPDKELCNINSKNNALAKKTEWKIPLRRTETEGRGCSSPKTTPNITTNEWAFCTREILAWKPKKIEQILFTCQKRNWLLVDVGREQHKLNQLVLWGATLPCNTICIIQTAKIWLRS